MAYPGVAWARYLAEPHGAHTQVSYGFPFQQHMRPLKVKEGKGSLVSGVAFRVYTRDGISDRGRPLLSTNARKVNLCVHAPRDF